ncbi:HNH endonuclease [Endozoicomonas sp. ONNA1]
MCNECEEFFDINQMEADHITPWSEGVYRLLNVELCPVWPTL